MGKVESNKIQKLNSLLNTAFELFTTKGVNKTSIAEISNKAGIAKGTFYLYFKDKYDIRNKLISHESSKLFKEAVHALNKEEGIKEFDSTIHLEANSLEYKIIYIVDFIIDTLNNNQTLLTFISKNLSWGIFKEALTTNVAKDDINFKDVFYEMIEDEKYHIIEPEIMLFLITELVGSTTYSVVLEKEPVEITKIKPYLYSTIVSIIKQHTGSLK